MTSPTDSDRVRLRRLLTADLSTDEVLVVRAIMASAFGDDEEERFTDEDWAHSIGGVHVVLELDGQIASHASVVEREIHIDGKPLRTGYVEAVATTPDRQGGGLGTIVMAEVNRIVGEGFALGVLGTGSQRFYERLGWQRWRGPSSVRTDAGLEATPDDDGYLMVLITPATPPIDLDAAISCNWRPGDVW